MKEDKIHKEGRKKHTKPLSVDGYSESAFSFRKEAIKITAIYLLFGFIWIVASDELVRTFVKDREILFIISVFKGLIYVLVTGALIYFLIVHYLRKMQKRQILLFSLLNSIPDLIFYKDPNGVYLGCNNAFEQFVGKDRSKIVGFTDHDLFDPEVAELFREMDLAMMNQKSERKNEEYVPYPDGKMVYLETLKTPYYDQGGNVLGLIGVSRDITERKSKEREIVYLSKTDVLTDLYNRRFFEEERARLDIEDHLPLSVIFADVNGLKLVNDSFGYFAGDAMLFETGRMIKTHCRKDDVVARIGGDEFCVLLPKTEGDAAREIVEHIQHSCEGFPIEIGNAMFKLSISFGYAVKSTSEEDLADIIKTAEDAMRRSKLLNRNSTRSDLMASIKATMLEKSHETAQHTDRMANLAKQIGKELNFTESLLFELELAANLHDIGKMSVSDDILLKETTLTEKEWEEIKKHPEVGYRIAQPTMNDGTAKVIRRESAANRSLSYQESFRLSMRTMP